MDKKNSRRRPKTFFLICLLTITVLPLGCGKEPPPPEEVVRPVKLMKLPPSGFFRELSLPASVKAFRQADLSFLVSGRLETVDVVRGQTVKKGQPLATLDPRDYQNALNAAKADSNQKKTYLNRIRHAMKKGAATETEEEQALADFQVAESRMKIHEKALGDTILKAPFTGEIGRQYRENFQDVAAKERVFLIQNISKIKIVIDVSESVRIMVAESSRNQDTDEDYVTIGDPGSKPDVSKRKGDRTPAVAIFDDLPGQTFPLTFFEEDQSADPDTRTYAVTLIMDAPVVGLILPGMSATVKGRFKVRTPEGKNTYTIPGSAVFSGPDAKRYVWVYKPDGKDKDDADFGTVSQKEVKVKALQGNQIEIIGKFDDGARIAISGVHYLKDGMKVKPLTFKAQRDAE
jgi:RND family efflux transporter MFP subunit